MRSTRSGLVLGPTPRDEAPHARPLLHEPTWRIGESSPEQDTLMRPPEKIHPNADRATGLVPGQGQAALSLGGISRSSSSCAG